MRRFDSRGDVLMTTPVLRGLREKYPEVHVTYESRNPSAELLLHNPLIDRLETRPLNPRDFDEFVELNRAYEDSPCRATKHAVDIFCEHALVRPSSKRLILQLTEEERSRAAHTLQQDAPAEGPLVGLGLHAHCVPERSWPNDRWEQVAAQLLTAGCKVMTFGGEREQGLCAPGVVNMMGRTTYRQAAALIEQCDLFVTVDTGLLHVAAAFGVPIVGLFGPIAPETRMPQEGPGEALTPVGVDCAPCTARCVRRGECMLSIEPEAVTQAAGRLLRARQHRQRGPADR